MLKSRLQFSNQGLGNMRFREVDPSPADDFENVGYLGGTNLKDVEEVDIIKDERGDTINVLSSVVGALFETKLKQVSIDQVALLNGAAGKSHSMQYYGEANNHAMFQFFCSELGKIVKKIERAFEPGEQNIPLEFIAIKKDSPYDIPYYYMAETKGYIQTEYLKLWINPRSVLPYNILSTAILDISGFATHGTLNGGAHIAEDTLPVNKLVLDGVNDYVDFGNVFNIPDLTDPLTHLFEGWFKVTLNSPNNYLFSKIEVGTGVGYSLALDDDGFLKLYVNDGVEQSTETDNVDVQDEWIHVGLHFDLSANITVFLNGEERIHIDATAIPIEGPITNASGLVLGTEISGSSFTDMEVGAFRVHRNLPALYVNGAQEMCEAIYAAEREYFGL